MMNQIIAMDKITQKTFIYSDQLIVNLETIFYTHPVGLVKPATLHAPLAGPEGYNS